MVHSFDVLILGGGAAGLMCAIEAGNRGRRVAVLERSERLGKKILISGGGRCNFTNLRCEAENFISANPHFAKSALARYTPADFIALVERHRIPYHEKTLGQLFCDRSARDILGMLESECLAARIEVFLNTTIAEVRDSNCFVLHSNHGEFHAPALVVATGGLSIPKIGATSFGFDLARQFGLSVRDPRPALVPLVLDAEQRSHYCDLAGISAHVTASCGSHTFREKMLITQRGLSGPSILQISSYWKQSQAIDIDLAPGQMVFHAPASSNPEKCRNTLRAQLRQFLPKRFADRWLDLHLPSPESKQASADLEKQLHSWKITPAGSEGYEKAEVTAGGVDTDELSARTMESRKVPGLFFIGEVVDVTGQLGGFNFQWAWASGAAAGRAV